MKVWRGKQSNFLKGLLKSCHKNGIYILNKSLTFESISLLITLYNKIDDIQRHTYERRQNAAVKAKAIISLVSDLS